MILDLFNESSIFDVDDVTNESLEPEIENAEATPLKEGENITDAYFRITLENVQNYNNIMNTVAVAEMAYMEKNGATTPVYEAKDLKSFKDTIVHYVQLAWSKIKGLFEAAINAVKGIFDKDMEKRYQQAIKDGKISPSDVVTVKRGVKIDGPVLTGIPSKVNSVISSAMSDLLADATGMSAEDAKSKAADWKESKTAKINAMRGKVIGAFGGESGSCTSKEFGSKLASTVSAKIEGEVKIKIGDAYSNLKMDESVKDLRKGFKEVEKTFNEFMKEAKKIEKDAKKDKVEAAMTIGAMNVNVIKESINVLNATSHQFIKIASKRASMCKSVISAGIRKAGSKKKDYSKKEEPKTKNTDDTSGKNIPGAVSHENADLICDLI